MSLAAEAVFAGQEDRNPYAITYHVDECTEEIWQDRDADLLLPVEEISERDCDACTYEWELWDRIIADSGSAKWGDIVLEILELEDWIEIFGPPPHMTPTEYQYLRAVKAERSRRQVFRTWQAGQKTK